RTHQSSKDFLSRIIHGFLFRGGGRRHNRSGSNLSNRSEDLMAVSPNFEIPQQLRELAEKNLEQARAGYGQFMDAMTQAMGMWAQGAPANPMTAGFKVVQ